MTRIGDLIPRLLMRVARAMDERGDLTPEKRRDLTPGNHPEPTPETRALGPRRERRHVWGR